MSRPLKKETMMGERTWTYDEDRCYHGTDKDRIFVELTEYGWTERETTTRLRELASPDPAVTFRWGYDGGGPMRVAEAVLTDALGDVPEQGLCVAFVEDFVSQLPDEWRLRRGAILRWVRGIACQLGMHDFPESVPPVNRREYRRRPPGLEQT